MAWFTLADLQAAFPQYKKVQSANQDWVTLTVIPDAERFVNSYIRENYTGGDVPTDVDQVARNYAVNKILADDENVRIAQARGQPSFVVAGNQINLDLNLGRNPLLSPEDQAVLDAIVAEKDMKLVTDRVVVRTQGKTYADAPGGGDTPSVDYVRQDLPTWFAGQ